MLRALMFLPLHKQAASHNRQAAVSVKQPNKQRANIATVIRVTIKTIMILKTIVIITVIILKTHHSMPCNYASKSNIFRSLVIEKNTYNEKEMRYLALCV